MSSWRFFVVICWIWFGVLACNDRTSRDGDASSFTQSSSEAVAQEQEREEAEVVDSERQSTLKSKLQLHAKSRATLAQIIKCNAKLCDRLRDFRLECPLASFITERSMRAVTCKKSTKATLYDVMVQFKRRSNVPLSLPAGLEMEIIASDGKTFASPIENVQLNKYGVHDIAMDFREKDTGSVNFDHTFYDIKTIYLHSKSDSFAVSVKDSLCFSVYAGGFQIIPYRNPDISNTRNSNNRGALCADLRFISSHQIQIDFMQDYTQWRTHRKCSPEIASVVEQCSVEG